MNGNFVRIPSAYASFLFARAVVFFKKHLLPDAPARSQGRKGQDMYFDQMEFSRRLQNLRKEKGMIQENLAPELHISLEHLKKLEGGSRRASYELLVLYSIYFDVSIDYLLTGRDHLNKQTLDKLGHVMAELAFISREMA